MLPPGGACRYLREAWAKVRKDGEGPRGGENARQRGQEWQTKAGRKAKERERNRKDRSTQTQTRRSREPGGRGSVDCLAGGILILGLYTLTPLDPLLLPQDGCSCDLTPGEANAVVEANLPRVFAHRISSRFAATGHTREPSVLRTLVLTLSCRCLYTIIQWCVQWCIQPPGPHT